MYSKLNNLEQAIVDYTKAITLDSKNKNFLVNRAKAYYANKNSKRAIADYNTAIALYLNDSDLYEQRGNIYYDENDFQQAIYDYTRAFDLGSKNWNLYRERGEKLGDLENAISDYEKYLSNEKQHYLYDSKEIQAKIDELKARLQESK